MPINRRITTMNKKLSAKEFFEKFGNRKPIDSDEYQKHRVFSELEKYMDFYGHLSDSVFRFVTPGIDGAINLDMYMFSSIKGTLHSIQLVLKNGRINDAYSLLRKYYDSAIINIYSHLYLDENSSIDSYIVAQINNWLNGKEQLPKIGEMSRYIRESDKVSEINNLLDLDGKYKKIRKRCNDCTHYNYFSNIRLNDNEAFIVERIKILDVFSNSLRDILILHLAYLFYYKDLFMSSTDYIEALELNLKPEEDSLYWVASFVQTMFDEIISKERPDITEAIKRNTCMQLS